jgi:hypothetical protein
MQPEDSSLVRKSPFSIDDLPPTLTFLILGSVIGSGLATAASLFHRHTHRSGEILLLAALFAVPTFVFWQWAVLRQALQGSKVVRATIANNTVRRGQEKEHKSPQLANVAPLVGVATQSRFIHSGSVGSWRNRSSAEQIVIMERTAGPLSKRLGYTMNSTGKENFALASLPQAVVQQ